MRAMFSLVGLRKQTACTEHHKAQLVRKQTACTERHKAQLGSCPGYAACIKHSGQTELCKRAQHHEQFVQV